MAEKSLDSGFKQLRDAAREEPRCSNIFQQGPRHLDLKNLEGFKDLQPFRDPTKDESEGLCPLHHSLFTSSHQRELWVVLQRFHWSGV